MDLIFNYQRVSQIYLWAGVLLGIITPAIGWFAAVGAVGCIAYAIIAHVSHVGQMLAKETLEIRKRLKTVELHSNPEASV